MRRRVSCTVQPGPCLRQSSCLRTDAQPRVTSQASWLLLALFLLSFSGRASAVACTTFSATAVNFGNYTGAVISPGSSPLSVSCPSGQTYNLLLNKGASSTGTETVRQMGVTTKLNYGLYQNAARTTNFGNSVPTGLYSGTGTGATQSIPLFPQLTAGQIVAPGTYTDTITATLSGNSSGSTTFTVTATVVANCTVSATALAFGTYTFTSSSNNSATLSVTCTNTTTYTVGLNAGVSTGATVTNRAMTGPAASLLLHYSLYQDAAHTLGWDTSAHTEAGTGTGITQPLTVYGNVPSGQAVNPGSYTDTITVTVTY